MRTWILAVIAALGVTIGGFNVGRAADANCPTCTQEAQAGDALSIFLAMMQSAPPGAFKYQDAKSLGPNAFELTGVVFMFEGPGSELPIQHFLVENIDLATLMQGGMPNVIKIKLEGIGFNDKNMDIDSDIWEALGTRQLLANLSIDMLSDPATKAFTLNDLTLDVPGIGQAQLKLDLLGVGPEAMMSPESALFTGSLKSASLMLNDQGFVGRSLDAAIKESGGMTEAELMGEAMQELANNLAEIGGQPGDRIFQVGSAFGGWLQDARSPKGPIVVTLAPAQPVNFQQLNQVSGAGEAAEMLNLQVSYGGTFATLPEPQAAQPPMMESYVFTDKDTYDVGEVVTVFWSSTPGNQQDVVAVVPEGAAMDDLGANWTYTNGVTDGSYQVAGLADGFYEVRVFYADDPSTLQASYYFQVGSGGGGGAQPEMGAATVGTDKATYKVGETVVVFWSGLPGNPQDWVTVAPAGSSPDEWGQWTYTSGQATGAYQVQGLTPGDYEARVYFDYPAGGNTIHATSSFTVTP